MEEEEEKWVDQIGKPFDECKKKKNNEERKTKKTKMKLKKKKIDKEKLKNVQN